MDYEIAYGVAYYRAIQDSLRLFLKAREKTMHVLTEICLEMQSEGKVASKRRTVCSLTSLASTVGSVALMVAAPATGGASGAAAVALAGFTGVSALGAIGTSVKQKIVEKGLLKKAEIALDADRRAIERLRAAAAALRDVACLAGDVVKLTKNAQLGLDTARGVINCPRAIDLATNVVNTTQEVAKLTKSVLIIASIPLDILALILEARESRAGNYSDTAKVVWDQVLAMQKEYETAQQAYRGVRVLLKDIDG